MEAMPAKRSRLSPPPSQQSFFDRLPDSMVEEILLRLPLSSVFASRCVSKLFLSLTTSPFIQAFRRHNPPSNEEPPLGFLLQMPYSYADREFSVCPRVPDIKFSGFSLIFPPGVCLDRNVPIPVVGSCHDLILCSNRERFQSDYFVVNPITRQCVALPPPPRLHELVLTGLVCDPASDTEDRKGGKLRYRVVRIPVSRRNSLTQVNVEIYSSEDGQWNEFAVPNAEGLTSLFWSFRAVACDGILYWKLVWGGLQVMRLDPFNSKKIEIRAIQDPPDSFDAGLEKYKLGVCQGKLRMCQVSWSSEGYYSDSEPSRVKIWELEDGDGRAEWRLAKEVWLQEIGISGNYYVQLQSKAKANIYPDFRFMWPLAFHPSKEDTIYFGCDSTKMKKIICYDLKRKSVDIVGDFSLNETAGGFDAFAFQLPWWPTPVADPSSCLAQAYLSTPGCFFGK